MRASSHGFRELSIMLTTSRLSFEPEQLLRWLLVVFVLSRTVCYIVDSFSWPMDGDISFLYYISWLINEHDYVPYEDVHETSFFGTFIFYSALTELVGYSTTAFHVVDTLFFLALSWMAFHLLKPFGALTGLLAVGLFGESYYQYGASVHLQRDFVALLPAALALIISQHSSCCARKKCFFVGMLFAVAACIKPQFGFGMLLVVALIVLDSGESWIKAFLAAAIGAISIGIAGAGWLVYHGILDDFLDMALNYLPHYSTINGRNFARQPIDSWIGAFKWMFERFRIFGLPLLISMFVLLRYKPVAKPHQRLVGVLFALWVVYLIYVTMAGKYWEYHVLPSSYFLAMCLAMVVVQVPGLTVPRLVSVGLLLVWLLLAWFIVFQQSWRITPNTDKAYNARIEEATAQLAGYLSDRLKPGDRVQSHVSHTHTAIFPAMREARAIPATPYLENYLLYHDIDQPFVQHARERFLQTLQREPPRFIIVTPTVFFFHGEKTEKVFRPFEEWLAQHYERVYALPDQPGQRTSEYYEVFEYRGQRH